MVSIENRLLGTGFVDAFLWQGLSAVTDYAANLTQIAIDEGNAFFLCTPYFEVHPCQRGARACNQQIGKIVIPDDYWI
jgi:hypothetical protein